MVRVLARLSLALLTVALSAPALAQNPCIADRDGDGVRSGRELRCLDLQLFLPSAAPGSTFTIERPRVARHLTYVVGLSANGALAPLSRDNLDGGADDLVPYMAQADLLFALGLFEALEISAALPLAVLKVADDTHAEALSHDTVLRLADVRLGVKVPFLWGEHTRLAAKLGVTLPTGDEQNFVSTGYWTLNPALLLSHELGPATLAGELGYRRRRQAELGDESLPKESRLEQDDELEVAVGGQLPVGRDTLALIAESRIRLGVFGGSFHGNEMPWEVEGGVRLTPRAGFHVDVGLGSSPWAEGYGATRLRAFVVARYASEREACPEGPEDYDGFEDGDFCADADNDRDGLPDEADECPNDAEDRDGFRDADGCPDADDDADGILDSADACPRESEDRDGYQDTDGCPEPDNDGDGVIDGLDECPMEGEDLDRYQDEDGCPEPGPEAVAVTLTDTRILISERIYFDFDRDTIRSVSRPLLDSVAEVILQLAEDRRIRVEGHSDADGVDRYNLDLSYRRARAVVEYLRGVLAPRGFDPDRIEYTGRGAAQPVAPNDTADGRALNRRVEFYVINPEDEPRPPRRRR